MFERLAKTALLRRAHANATGAAHEEGTLELGVAADVLLAVNEAEGRGRREDEDGNDVDAASEKENGNDVDAASEKENGNDVNADSSPPAPKKADPRAALADALSSAATSRRRARAPTSSPTRRRSFGV